MKKLMTILVFCLIILLNTFSVVFAQDYLEANSLAISLVIDTSGSMEETDPQKFRQKVAEGFIDYLHEDDYLGIMTFNSGVDFVIPIQQLSQQAVRAEMRESLSSHMDGYGNTDYNAVLIEANNQLKQVTNTTASKIIILMTDGEPYAGATYLEETPIETYMDNLWTTVSTIAGNQYSIYSIGFTEGINVEVLNRMASETNGNVRIYENDEDLDTNLIQLLESREAIIDEILEPPQSTTDVGNLKPTISAESWFSDKGYRVGEETVVSASVMAGNMRVKRGGDLNIDTFEMVTVYDDGTELRTPLFDDGESEHSDIRANDGLWTNRLSFTQTGTAKAQLEVTGTLREEPLNIKEDMGEFLVAEDGSIFVTQQPIKSPIKMGEKLDVSLNLDNNSDFNERLFVLVSPRFGTASLDYVDLEPNQKSSISFQIEMNNDVESNRFYDFSIQLTPENSSTTINQERLDYKIEVLSGLTMLIANSSNLLPLVLIVMGIILLFIIIGLILYGLLVIPQKRVHGTLIYWPRDEQKNKREIDLSKMKRQSLIISFGYNNHSATIRIFSKRYNYDLILQIKMPKTKCRIIQGYIAFFTRKPLTELVLETTQPGIIEQDGTIKTSVNLSHNDCFSSGEYCFRYESQHKSRFTDSEKGKNILEGRV